MYHKTKLTNGLRVVTHQMKERDSVSLGFWVGTGGRYEDDRIKGAAHFLEHILFKGSRNYSCGEIKERIEGVGGSLNAFTAEEQTCFYAKIPAQYLKRAFAILADMVFHPLIRKKDVVQEKGVIVEEIKMYHDLPQYFVMELLDSMIWPGHPLGKSLAGTQESITGMTERDLRDFHSQYYVSPDVVVVACGQVVHRDFVHMVGQALQHIPHKEPPGFLPFQHTPTSSMIRFHHKPIEQMHLALGMPGFPDDHPARYILCLLHVILGGNMSSRLFDEVREKRGLAYSISSSMKSFKDTGLFLIRAGVDNRKIIDALELILSVLKKIKRNGVARDEFTRAKDFYLGQVRLGLEDTLDHMLWLGESVLTHNRMRTLEEVVKEIKRIRIDDIQRVAIEVLNEQRFHLALVGPIQDKQEGALRDLLGVKGVE
jgi:predicted Zn-dependent peptidase